MRPMRGSFSISRMPSGSQSFSISRMPSMSDLSFDGRLAGLTARTTSATSLGSEGPGPALPRERPPLPPPSPDPAASADQ